METPKEYDVTITATVTKTISVEADNEDDAIGFAHEQFTVECEDAPTLERYEQETDRVEEVEEDEEDDTSG